LGYSSILEDELQEGDIAQDALAAAPYCSSILENELQSRRRVSVKLHGITQLLNESAAQGCTCRASTTLGSEISLVLQGALCLPRCQ
jgi:hypothetical protein